MWIIYFVLIFLKKKVLMKIKLEKKLMYNCDVIIQLTKIKNTVFCFATHREERHKLPHII